MITPEEKRWLGIGATIAVLLFVAVSFSGEPLHRICQSPNEQETVCSSYHLIPYFFLKIIAVTDAHEGFFSLLTGAAVALFTLGLVGLGWKDDQHFRVSERAYVKLSHDEPGVRWEGNTGKFKIVLKITNHGDTPARVTDVVTNFFLPPPDMRITELPPYVRHDFPQETKAFLVKDDCFYQHIELSVEPAEQVALGEGTVKMIFFGYADYIDQFGVRYRAGYGRQYLRTATVNNLIFPDEGPFNYDRKRSRREGSDWD